ncbi:glycosyltransferase family 4 protein [Thermococcus sp. CX2]|uniref:glycosyltransferase family 4 protein n=1 Tax=Thermococcus sp. CX2 TaxID=163006 RepID=UPI00143C36E7
MDLVKSQHNRPHQFVKYLSKKHNITVVSINDWWKGKQHDFEEYSKEWRKVLEKIDIVYVTDKRISPVIQENAYPYFAIKRLLKNKSFDVHINYNSLTLGYFATKSLLKQGVPTIFDLADDLVGMISESPQIPRPLRPIGAKVGREILKKNIKLSKKITVTNSYLKEKYNIPNNKAVVLPNGVDTELFRNYGNTKSQLGLEDYFVVGYVGVLREWVDFEPIYQALRELPEDIIFLVVGKEGRYQENIELAKKYGVIEKVRFVGNVPYSKVPVYISAMDVGVIPFKLNSITEHALPLKLFEYMACEKPVISTSLPAVMDVAKEEVLYANTNKEWKEKILLLYENCESRNYIGNRGRTFVERNYDWKRILEIQESILEESLK